MSWEDTSLILCLYRGWKYRRALEAAEAAEPAPPPPITMPERVAVVRTIRGYWRGCHPRYGHRWHRDIGKAARFRTVEHAERDAAHTFLARETRFTVELVDYDYTG